MEKFSKAILKHAGEQLMLDMSDSELYVLEQELSVLKEQMDLLGAVSGIDESEPLAFPYDVETTYLREDIAQTPLSVEQVKKNAPHTIDDAIKVPKVVG